MNSIRTISRARLLLIFSLAIPLTSPRVARAIDVPIGLSLGWADCRGSLEGTVRPGWRLWVGLSGDLPDQRRVGVSFGVHHFHFEPEPRGHVIEGTGRTLQDAQLATMGFLQGEGRYELNQSNAVRPFAEAGVGIGYMNFGYNAIGADSTGLWADGVFALDLALGVGANVRVAKRLKLCADARVDLLTAVGAAIEVYSVNVGPVILVHFPGLSEMQPGWMRRGADRRGR